VKLEKSVRAKDKRKNKTMRVSGKSVFGLQRIIRRKDAENIDQGAKI